MGEQEQEICVRVLSSAYIELGLYVMIRVYDGCNSRIVVAHNNLGTQINCSDRCRFFHIFFKKIYPS